MQSWLKRNAHWPEEKMFQSRNRLAKNWICRRESNFADTCKDICRRIPNLLTKKNCLWNLLTKTRSADNKNLLTKSADEKNLLTQSAYKRNTSDDGKLLKNLLRYLKVIEIKKHVIKRYCRLQLSFLSKNRLTREICRRNRMTENVGRFVGTSMCKCRCWEVNAFTVFGCDLL